MTCVPGPVRRRRRRHQRGWIEAHHLSVEQCRLAIGREFYALEINWAHVELPLPENLRRFPCSRRAAVPHQDRVAGPAYDPSERWKRKKPGDFFGRFPILKSGKRRAAGQRLLDEVAKLVPKCSLGKGA